MVEEEHFYGSFSPRVSPCPPPQLNVSAASESKDIDGSLAPVLEIISELPQLCEESSVELSVELGSHDALAVESPIMRRE